MHKRLPLETSIRVRESGVRAVNVEYDLAQPAIADGYVVTAQARQTLARLLAGLDPNSSHRAWTLTGPYGSGKSYFALFVMNLLGKSLPGHASAVVQLAAVDAVLATQIQHVSAAAPMGLLPIPVTGFRGSLHACLRAGCRHALEPMAVHPAIQALLDDDFLALPTVDSRAVIHWFQRLQRALHDLELGYGGCLLVIDEMGKLLEYAATHPVEVDLYLLQELAEFASRSGATPVVVVGILHQSFERYTGHLDTNSQREWDKIQGRFEDIAFQEPLHQQMWLIQRALAVEDVLAQSVAPMMVQAAQAALDAGWRPPLMREQEFLELVAHAYPLHPSVLVALPYLFYRLAQNERSFFAFLAAHEPFGFQEFLHRSHVPTTVRLADLFDYLTVNFQGRLYTTLRARIITETLARLENTPNLPPLAVDVVKTVGLLNWLAENSLLVATEPSLLAALRSDDRPDALIQQTLERLQSQSLLVFRRFNRSYSVWQGSDVDLEEQLQQARRQLTSAFSLAEVIQEFLPPRPLVARRRELLERLN